MRVLPLTAEAIKNRFIGFDESGKTLMELIDFHNIRMFYPIYLRSKEPASILTIQVTGFNKLPEKWVIKILTISAGY